MTTPWSLWLLVGTCLLGNQALACQQEDGKGNYSLIFPKTIYYGEDMMLNMHTDNVQGDIFLRLELMDYDGRRVQEGMSYKLAGSVAAEISFPISTRRTSSYVYLHVVAWGAMEFFTFQQVRASDKPQSILIQTDKSVYKPGQPINFRALVVNADSRVSKEQIKVVITDPLYNNMGEWKRRYSKNAEPVLEGEVLTSVDSRVGQWRIVASIEGMTATKYVSLKEFDTPGYRVKMVIPNYVSPYAASVEGKITARYRTGAPVTGRVTVIAKLIYYYRRNITLEKEYVLDRRGVAKVNFSLAELKDLGYRTYAYGRSYYRRSWFYISYKNFNFTAVVTNDVTDEIITEETRVSFYYSYRSVLYFTTPTPYRFKPGMTYDAHVMVLGIDRKPAVANVTFSVYYYRPRPGNFTTRYYWHRAPMESVFLLRKTVMSNIEGRASMDFNLPTDATYRLYIYAVSGSTRAYRYSYKYSSPSDTYLSVRQKDQPMYMKSNNVSEEVELQLKANKPFGSFAYEIYSKGKLVMSDRVNKANSTEASVKVTLTEDMVPVANVVAFFTTPSGEVVADKTALFVKFDRKEISVTFNDDKVKPRQMTKLIVEAERDSTVYIYGWNKHDRKSGNNIEYDNVHDTLLRLAGYNTYSAYRTSDEFRNAGLDIITNSIVPGKYYQYPPRHYRDYSYYYYPRYRYVGYKRLSPLPSPPGKSLMKPMPPVDFMKKFMPDTWLWKTVKMSGSREVIDVLTPDTITPLRVTAFAIHPSAGLSILKEPAMAEPSQSLLVTLDIPRSAVRGEIVCFQANTYNNGENDETVTLDIAKDNTFFNVYMKKNEATGKMEQVEETTHYEEQLGVIKAGAVEFTTLCVKPNTDREITVSVRVQDNRPSGRSSDTPFDRVRGTILIEPEGVGKSESTPVLIDITANEVLTKTVPVLIPTEAMSGSAKIVVTVFGNVMGLLMDRLRDLVKMPYGSGAQNMMHLSSNTFLLKYLHITERLPPAFLRRAKNVFMAAYDRQLSYQRYDGSFSSFGNRDSCGNMWLTAFVTKSFVQAKELEIDGIVIEKDVIKRAIGMMTQYQDVDGGFREMGEVIPPSFQGDAHGTRLTAYVSIALMAAKKGMTGEEDAVTLARINVALSKAVTFMERRLKKNKDAYTANILAYALILTKSKKANKAVIEMRKNNVTEGDTIFWNHTSTAISVEMTSYGMLSLLHSAKYDEAMQVYRWLIKQMGPTGDFVTVQATSLGVEALAAMTYVSIGKTESSITMKVKSDSKEPINIKKENVLLPYRTFIKVEKNTAQKSITIEAKSAKLHMLALAQVVLEYRVNNITELQFSAHAVVKSTNESTNLETCIKASPPRPGSLLVTEINLPTGYRVARTGSNYGNAMGVEFVDGKAVLYYYGSQLNATAECSMLNIYRSVGIVANPKPTFVKVFESSDPSKVSVSGYQMAHHTLCYLGVFNNCPTAP